MKTFKRFINEDINNPFKRDWERYMEDPTGEDAALRVRALDRKYFGANPYYLTGNAADTLRNRSIDNALKTKSSSPIAGTAMSPSTNRPFIGWTTKSRPSLRTFNSGMAHELVHAKLMRDNGTGLTTKRDFAPGYDPEFAKDEESDETKVYMRGHGKEFKEMSDAIDAKLKANGENFHVGTYNDKDIDLARSVVFTIGRPYRTKTDSRLHYPVIGFPNDSDEIRADNIPEMIERALKTANKPPLWVACAAPESTRFVGTTIHFPFKMIGDGPVFATTSSTGVALLLRQSNSNYKWNELARHMKQSIRKLGVFVYGGTVGRLSYDVVDSDVLKTEYIKSYIRSDIRMSNEYDELRGRKLNAIAFFVDEAPAILRKNNNSIVSGAEFIRVRRTIEKDPSVKIIWRGEA